VARKLHSKEIHIIVGASEELEFPEGISERRKIGMLGKVMNGHCVRALGAAAHSYLHTCINHPLTHRVTRQHLQLEARHHTSSIARSTTQDPNSLKI
jgi:hypothetical protein